MLQSVRMIVATVVLSAFVLAITYGVKGLSTLTIDDVISLTSPVLSKIGINEEDISKVAGVVGEKVFGKVLELGISEFGGVVAGDEETKESSESSSSKTKTDDGKKEDKKEILMSVAITSDSHNFNGLLTQALNVAKNRGIGTVFNLGDLTDWGDVGSLQDTKEALDAGGLYYYVLPGDHDLAQSVGLQNFKQVFGENYHSVTVSGVKIVMLDNGANYSVVDDAQMVWFKQELENASFVLLSQPIYVDPDNILSGRVMGRVNGEDIKKVKEQAGELLKLIRESKVKAVIAGDHHRSSKSDDPEKEELKHYVVGAVVNNSEGLRTLQSPRFSILKVYTNGDYELEEVVLE